MACELGFLYNKEVIIEKLLDSKANKDATQKNDIGSHIRSLKVRSQSWLLENLVLLLDNSIGEDGNFFRGGAGPKISPRRGRDFST